MIGENPYCDIVYVCSILYGLILFVLYGWFYGQGIVVKTVHIVSVFWLIRYLFRRTAKRAGLVVWYLVNFIQASYVQLVYQPICLYCSLSFLVLFTLFVSLPWAVAVVEY